MARYFLCAGHGNFDCGAIGNGYQEWKLARQFNDLLARYLRELGQSVQIYNSDGPLATTKDMYQQSLKGKGLYSFKVDDRVVYEIHLNSAADKSAHGTEVWIGTGLAADKYDKAIIKVLAKYFANRGIKKSSALLNMNIAKQRGINYRLIELCFISNKSDVAKFVKEMDNIAREMAEESTGKSLKPKKVSQAIGKAYFLNKTGGECWLYIYPWDIYRSKINNVDRYAHEIEINTKDRAIYSVKTGKKVSNWKNQVTRYMYINTELEKKMKRL